MFESSFRNYILTAEAFKEFRSLYDVLQEECRRRWRLDPNSKTPKLENSNHDAPRCVEYLLTHPVTRQNERNFLVTEEKKVRTIITEANQERDATKKQNKGFRWNTENTVRLFHALVEDDIRQAYINRYLSKDREGLDGQHSEEKPPSVEQLIADKMNDEDFVCGSLKLPNLETMFKNDLKTEYDDCMNQNVTSELVAKRIADLKTKVMHIVKNFERSGNGDGNLIDSEKGSGHTVM